MAPSQTPLPLRRRRLILFRLLAICLGVLAGLVPLEIALQLYPPALLRIRGGRIFLPLNQRTEIKNASISKVDRVIVQTRNSLGFRGADPPADLANKLSLVTVGGSTTECYYLSDDKTWTERLHVRLDREFRNVWINNAGLDGHTTFGHRHLLDQYLVALRPKVILFLIGANDVGLDKSREDDDRLQRDHEASGIMAQGCFWVIEHSATAALLDNFRRTFQARAAGVTHQDIHHGQLQWNENHTVEVSAQTALDTLGRHRHRFLPGYRRRVQALVEQSRKIHALPILMTQPVLFGPAKDPETGVDLARVAMGDLNGDVQWQILELYNSVTRDVARELGVPVIDLGGLLPKDSRLYYDYYHFTNEGAVEVAEIVDKELAPILLREFPESAVPSQHGMLP